jgi:hypothetical protein
MIRASFMTGLIFEQAPEAAKCKLNELREVNRWGRAEAPFLSG